MDLMKAKMAEAKAKQQEKLAQIKALKASKGGQVAAAPTPRSSQSVPRPAAAPAALAAASTPAEQSALPAGFFDQGNAPAPAPAPAPSAPAAVRKVTLSELGKPAPQAAAPPPAAPKQPTVGLALAYGDSDEESGSDEDAPVAAVPAKQPAQPATAQRSDAAVALPDGFFDDKAKDAAVHGREAPVKRTAEEELALFEEELEEDFEAVDKMQDEEARQHVAAREKEEKEEQQDLVERVRELREAREKLAGRRGAEASGGVRKRSKFLEVSDGDDSGSSSDDEAMLDWRRKAV